MLSCASCAKLISFQWVQSMCTFAVFCYDLLPFPPWTKSLLLKALMGVVVCVLWLIWLVISGDGDVMCCFEAGFATLRSHRCVRISLTFSVVFFFIVPSTYSHLLYLLSIACLLFEVQFSLYSVYSSQLGIVVGPIYVILLLSPIDFCSNLVFNLDIKGTFYPKTQQMGTDLHHLIHILLL